jgi:hypothetical protein
LFVFADVNPLPAALDLPAQKAMLRERFGEGKWECPRILGDLDRTQDLYFDRVSQIKMERWSRTKAEADALRLDNEFQRAVTTSSVSPLSGSSHSTTSGRLNLEKPRRGRDEASTEPTPQ